MECAFVELFGWSLKDIDETDSDSLLLFFGYYPYWKSHKKTGAVRKYADQVNWM